jgi:hypothetical protein
MKSNKYLVLDIRESNYNICNLGYYMFNYATLYNISIKNNALVFSTIININNIFKNILYNKKKILCNYSENQNEYKPIPFINGMKLNGDFLNLKYFDASNLKLKKMFELNSKYNKFSLPKKYLNEYVYIYIGTNEMDFLTEINENYYIDAINNVGINNKFIFFVNNDLKKIYINIIKKLKNIKYYNVYYFDNNDILDLFSLFLQIKKLIIPNSLLLWWVTYLSYENKTTIVVPLNWFIKEKSLLDKNYIMMKKFIKINNKIHDEEDFFKKYIIKDDAFYKNNCIKAFIIPENGIGANMFIIATAYSLAKDNNCNIVVNDEKPLFIENKNNNLPVTVSQLFPNINCIDDKIFYPYRFIEQYPSNKLANINFKYGLEIRGWYRSYTYFYKYRKELIKLFDFSPKIKDYTIKVYKNIFSTYNDIIGIHIRRNDYKLGHYIKPLSEMYFYNAINKLIKNKITNSYLFIFVQDDESIEWVKKSSFMKLITTNFKNYQFCLDNAYVTMYIMTLCKYLITANSSYSYMGAFLNTQKSIIYCPNGWYNKLHKNYKIVKYIEKYIYPPTWIKINFIQ